MNTLKRPKSDRRTSPRAHQRIPAWVGRDDALYHECETAEIEDSTPGGFRIRSAEPLKEGDSISLYLRHVEKPMAADVVWVREEGTIQPRYDDRLASAFVAGCRRKPKPRSARTSLDADEIARFLVRLVIVGGMLGFAGLVVYFFFTLSQVAE